MANRGGRETFFDWITGWRRARTIRSLNAPRLSGSGVAEQKSERLYSDKPVNFCLYPESLAMPHFLHPAGEFWLAFLYKSAKLFP
jgi:hypothetical protein